MVSDDRGLLEQLQINKYTFFLHDYGGPVGFLIVPENIRLTHC